ncbi:nickel import ATP-binding protein NikE [Brevibacillus porteri]|uniref:Nickel import ATP-binding protein NikE n=1 Tax=Brevibacillus porteri TaxID=2126350 RepID=A0ABX5FV95_9BACL|nr:nickel import ATP-binding protein NikE [Brevibacillus porteri]MED1798846.1 nickel import ATP-binding protein NikE [Brevibacillus porteri]MED2131529.1 nickel import ATP-binding protein NikE [Brevibacillus porteri]MED2744082.1 nickel import ATP-binding protein NikE [Brevibacillus porteri]MED2813296.1 nickel import ATP-binding protein NikE [Brevibacillus porteri]MED2896614.1 nickel import ATP-binding protein NikE [Brevibacillus porteri]
MSLLEIKGISKTYPIKTTLWGKGKRLEAVKNVSLTLHEGACLGLVGESGSGKSTLGKMILGLERPDHGEIFFQGKNLFQLAAKEQKELRQNLQVVFQDCYSSVNPRLSIGNIIAEPIKNYEKLTPEEEKKRVGELLEKVGLSPGNMDKYPHQLSGGQLQRVNIARAIALHPKLIVLDEAVSSLDVFVQAQILDLLADLKKEFQLAYLFITHDLQAVQYMADRLAVMYKGQIIEMLDNTNQLEQLEHPISKNLLSSMLRLHPKG